MTMASIPVYIKTMKCTACISEYLAAKMVHDALVDKEGAEEPSADNIRDAITLAPAWQQLSMQGQLVVACVPVPSCMEHLTNNEKTPEQRLAEAGLAIPR